MLFSPSAVAAQSGQDLPRGVIVDDVVSRDDTAQSYALYLPSDYSPDRAWSLLLAFHAGARGRAMVEKYQAAAERYGYIVAGSYRSRNGPADVSAAAVRAMSRDVGRRFTIDAARVYLTGMSGGARVAMSVALGPQAWRLRARRGTWRRSGCVAHPRASSPTYTASASCSRRCCNSATR